MKVRESVLRYKRFEAEEKMQKVTALEQMVHEFEQMATDLERQIQAEEERTGVRDVSHFAYSTFARSAAQRRENLLVSIADLHERLNALTSVTSQHVFSHHTGCVVISLTQTHFRLLVERLFTDLDGKRGLCSNCFGIFRHNLIEIVFRYNAID